MTAGPTTVEEYIAAQPDEVRETLHELRRRILGAAPEAAESIGYGMPAYLLANGRPVYFAAWRRHVSLHAVPALERDLEAAAGPFRSGKDTLKFPHRQPVPWELVTAVITAIARHPGPAGR